MKTREDLNITAYRDIGIGRIDPTLRQDGLETVLVKVVAARIVENGRASAAN